MKDILFGDDFQRKCAKGIETIYEAVSATMGPKGQVIIIERPGQAPIASKDGVTVAREVVLVDKQEQLGAHLVKEAAQKTNDIAGDGTTTATVLAYAIYREGRKLIMAGENPVTVKNQIEADTKLIVSELQKQAVPVTTREALEQVASISANDPVLGKVIAGLMDEVGKDGLITIEQSPTFGIETERTQGMKLEGGFLSPYMVTDPERLVFESQDCPVFVTDKKITLAAEVLPLFDKMVKKGLKDLVIIADNVEGEALATMVVNKQRGVFNSVAMRCPGIGDHRKREQMRDICALTGATFFSEETGKNLADATPDHLGKARKVTITKDHTILIGGYGKQDQVDIRVSAIKAELAETKSDYDQIKLKERLGHLTGSVGVIKIGGTNEVEIKEKKQRVEDAVNATKAAQEEGVVVGGGLALLRASNWLLEGVVKKACEYPMRTIVENAGKNADVVLSQGFEDNIGYNAAKDRYEDLMAAGIVDPLKVSRTALENASSIACLLLTAKAGLTVHEKV